jgi:pimeloyl-ACP methyl ester carboxylesterase
MELVRVGAQGPRALVIHGNDLCGAHYRALADALAARGVCTDLVTLPGFSHEPPLVDPSWPALVDALLNHCAADPPQALIGHSMGGLLALLVAARRPRWLRALALLEPAVFPSRWFASLALRRYLARIVQAAPDAPFVNDNGGQKRIADLTRYPRALLTLHEQVRRASDKNTAHALFTSAPLLYPLPLHDVNMPVVLVRGARSGWLSRVQARSLSAALHAQVHVVPDAAHWLMGEADDAVADVVAPFVRAHA